MAHPGEFFDSRCPKAASDFVLLRCDALLSMRRLRRIEVYGSGRLAQVDPHLTRAICLTADLSLGCADWRWSNVQHHCRRNNCDETLDPAAQV
jgi:hypothetical protein